MIAKIILLQHIKGSEAKVRQVPISKALNVEKILEFARTVCDIDKFIPKLKTKYPNRAWICTLGKFKLYYFIK